MLLTLLLVVALQRAKKPVVDTGVINWVSTDLVTQIVPRVSTLTSASCRLRPPVKVQGYGSHAEAAKESDQVLAGDGPRNPKLVQYEMQRMLAVWRHESNQKITIDPYFLG